MNRMTLAKKAVIIFGGAETIAQRILSTKRANLIQYLPLDDPAGTTTVRDASGNGRTGTASNVTFGSVAGPDGRPTALYNGLAMNAGGSYIDLYSTSYKNAFSGANGTFLCWCLTDLATWNSATGRRLFEILVDANNYLYVRLASNALQCDYKAGGSLSEFFMRTMTEITWLQFAMTWTTSGAAITVQFYLNGLPFGAPMAANRTWAGALSAAQTLLGAYAKADTSTCWKGNLAHCATWDTPLTTADIAHVYGTVAPAAVNGAYATNAAAALTTPTYDTSGQALHPGVVYIDAGWNNYKYWMVMTPFPGGDSTLENPSILASNDGTTWVVPDGLTNPIATKPADGFNSDADLILVGSTLHVLYRQNNSGVDALHDISSTDGVTWANDTVVVQSASGVHLVSPAPYFDGVQYVLWNVDTSGGAPYQLVRRTASAITGPWSAPVNCTINRAPIVTPAFTDWWHIDVLSAGGVLWMLIQVEQTQYYLYLAYSVDGGLTWTCAKNPLLSPTGGANWDGLSLYRGSLLHIAGGFDLFYSGYVGATVCHIGRTTITVPGL